MVTHIRIGDPVFAECGVGILSARKLQDTGVFRRLLSGLHTAYGLWIKKQK